MKKKLKLLSLSCLINIIAFAQTSTKLSLEEAIQIALENNFDVVIEKNAQQIGQINNNWGTAGLWPNISINSSAGIASNNLEQRLSNGTTIKRNGAILRNINAGFAVSWRIFDGMRMFATKKRLEELETIGELTFRRQLNATVFDVIVVYYQIVQLNQQKKAFNETIKFFEERKQIAESRFTIGTAPKTDFLQAQVDLNQQKGNLLVIENNIRVAKANFNNLLARTPETSFDVQDAITMDAAVNFALLQQKSQTDNYDLLLAQSSLSVLVQQKKEIISQRLPSVTLNGNFNLAQSRNDAGFTLSNRNFGPNTNLNVAIPIFQGGNIKRQVENAKIEIESNKWQMQQLQVDLVNTLNIAYQNYQNALEILRGEAENARVARLSIEIAMERYRLSRSTVLELAQIQQGYENAIFRSVAAKYEAKFAEIDLMRISGMLIR